MSEISSFAEAAVRTATPLLIASMGEAVTERSGIINIGVEGCMVAGAYAAFVVGATHGSLGYGSAALAGAAFGLIFALLSIRLRRDQIIVGAALTMLGLGLTGWLFRLRLDSGALVVATDAAVAIPGLSRIPIIGTALFAQPLVTYGAMLLVPLTWWFMFRTHAGLALRAIGEAPEAARAAGIPVRTIQAVAVVIGSALGGVAGGSLVLAQAGTFAENMSAGRGFLAIAIVALGRWRPAGVALASVVFGASMALQYVVQALGWNVRYELALMLPYVLTLVALGAFGKGVAPAMLGRVQSD